MAASSRVEEENARPGTRDWWPARHADDAALEAYTTQVSVLPGGRVDMCVSVRPAARYTASVYRLGWYAGAGARLMLELPSSPGMPQEAPLPEAETGLCRAAWPIANSFSVGEDWPSGQYAVRLTAVSGPHAGSSTLVPFVVRQPPGTAAGLLVQTGVNTWQAYNHWGGKSLYVSNSTDGIAAVKVSFDRPVPNWASANLNARAPFHYDVPLIRFLEREGFDVAYQTNVDTHREPWTLLTAKALACAGHDEYWTKEIRDGFERARDSGIHLAFLGANQCYWQIRYEDDERTLVEYRSRREDPIDDPALKTVQWRDLESPRPESRLIGVRYAGGMTSPDRLLSYEVVDGADRDRWGAAFSDRSPVLESVGYEWDALDPDFQPPGLVRFLHLDDQRSDADCIRWQAPSGALVFAAGSLAISHAVDGWARPGREDHRVQALLRNALLEMLG